MKALVSLVLAIALIGGIYLISTSGCGARAQVAGEKLLDKIDSWLGELEVKRTAIENEKKKLEDAIENVREQKVKAKVQLDRYQAMMDPVNSELTNIKRALGELQPHLAATEDVEIKGKTYTTQQVQEMANTLADEFESLSKRLGGYEVAVQAFQESYDMLARQQDTAADTMKRLNEKLEEIDIKREAVQAMQVNQEILGESGSISEKFVDLEKQIEDLFVDVETQMVLEKERLSERERDMNSRSESADAIMQDLESGSDATQARIDAILGKDNGGEE
ncbi:MAG: hypothetical protein ACR2NP_12830 [Pirellulaceae bacterium]